MRFLPTSVHGVIDYVAGIVILVLPWIFDWEDSAKVIMTILGLGVILYSLLTDYELGVARVIPMPTHLLLDALGGIVLIVAPFIFGIDDTTTRTVMIILGILEVGASLITQTTPSRTRRTDQAGRTV